MGTSFISRNGHLESVWMEEWKSGRMENCGRMEKWEDRKYLVFSRVFGWRSGKVGGWKTLLFGWREKWKDEKCNLYKLTIIPLLHNM